MERTAVQSIWQKVKDFVLYKPPQIPKRFVLKETAGDDGRGMAVNQEEKPLESAMRETEALLRYASRVECLADKITRSLKKGSVYQEIAGLKIELEELEKQLAEFSSVVLSYDSRIEIDAERVLSVSLEENLEMIKRIYHVPQNKDVVIREFEVPTEPKVKAAAIFVDGMVDTKLMNLNVLQPLMFADARRFFEPENFIEQVAKNYLPANQARQVSKFGEIEEGINSGDTLLIFEGITEALVIGTKGWEHRGVNRPSSEQSVLGSQAAFSENLRVNTALVRTTLKDSSLITEMIKIGRRSQLNCAVMYLASVANPVLIAEVKRRLNGICTDYIDESGLLLQFIEDHPANPFPQTVSTERPDRVGVHLSEGRVAIILEGNPFAHILPVSFFSFFHSAEDFGMKPAVGNFMRALRLFGTLIATVLPALYIAISYYHQEAMPTDLLLAVAGSRENVPFPAIFEVVIMEISFELIREAGLRIPGLLGSTIGIVGAIILGQAAVSAHIVSPIVVVVIAITGLASFTIPEFRMNSAIRLVRFLLLFFAVTMGLVGLGTGLLWLTVLLSSMKSFGVPYMSPIGPRTIAGYDVVLRGQVYQQENRPDELNTTDPHRQPAISRTWLKRRPAGGDKRE
jgi:spore germination protein KA